MLVHLKENVSAERTVNGIATGPTYIQQVLHFQVLWKLLINAKESKEQGLLEFLFLGYNTTVVQWKSSLLPASCWFLAWLPRPEVGGDMFPQNVHWLWLDNSVKTSQKLQLLITTAVRTSNPAVSYVSMLFMALYSILEMKHQYTHSFSSSCRETVHSLLH
jgi:hypothetical protein